MSDDPTLPPVRTTTTPRSIITKAIAWGKLHPDWLLAFVLGFIAGAVII